VIEDQGLAFALGAADYLTKPLDKNRLLESLRRHQIDLRGKHVLVVEDDPATRELVSRTLAATGCDVQFASTGLEALEMLGKAAEPPQLILLDLMMPELDGFEFLRELRARDAWRHVPVVVTTAKQLSNEDRERLRGQVQKIMQKGSYTRDDLVKEVSGALTTQP
jgi:CheY-like chemotaxis protein